MTNMDNIVSLLRAQFDLIKTGLFARAGNIDTLRNEARNLQTRAVLIAQRNNDLANDLENQMAALEQRIEQLDAEADEASLIATGAARLLGE